MSIVVKFWFGFRLFIRSNDSLKVCQQGGEMRQTTPTKPTAPLEFVEVHVERQAGPQTVNLPAVVWPLVEMFSSLSPGHPVTQQ